MIEVTPDDRKDNEKDNNNRNMSIPPLVVLLVAFMALVLSITNTISQIREQDSHLIPEIWVQGEEEEPGNRRGLIGTNQFDLGLQSKNFESGCYFYSIHFTETRVGTAKIVHFTGSARTNYQTSSVTARMELGDGNSYVDHDALIGTGTFTADEGSDGFNQVHFHIAPHDDWLQPVATFRIGPITSFSGPTVNIQMDYVRCPD